MVLIDVMLVTLLMDFTPNKKLYTDRAMLNPNDTPDNVIEGNVECIVINL